DEHQCNIAHQPHHFVVDGGHGTGCRYVLPSEQIYKSCDGSLAPAENIEAKDRCPGGGLRSYRCLPHRDTRAIDGELRRESFADQRTELAELCGLLGYSVIGLDSHVARAHNPRRVIVSLSVEPPQITFPSVSVR